MSQSMHHKVVSVVNAKKSLDNYSGFYLFQIHIEHDPSLTCVFRDWPAILEKTVQFLQETPRDKFFFLKGKFITILH